jgi:hypothetical protein
MSAKAKFKCTHEESRRKVCATYGRKIIFGKSSVSKFLITENINNLIKLHISALLWPRKLKLIPKNYHGHSFKGNAAYRKLLKESDAILEADVRGNVSPLQIVPFISAFKAMHKVVETCFSNLYVDPDVLENQLNYLKKCLLVQANQKLLKSTVLPVT